MMTFYDVRHEVKRKKKCQTDLRGWNSDRTEFLASQKFRYTHRTFQTLITAGDLKENLKPLSRTCVKNESMSRVI